MKGQKFQHFYALQVDNFIFLYRVALKTAREVEYTDRRKIASSKQLAAKTYIILQRITNNYYSNKFPEMTIMTKWE